MIEISTQTLKQVWVIMETSYIVQFKGNERQECVKLTLYGLGHGGVTVLLPGFAVNE